MVGSERETNFFRCEERKHLRLSNHLCTQHSTPLLHSHQLLLRLFAKVHSSSQKIQSSSKKSNRPQKTPLLLANPNPRTFVPSGVPYRNGVPDFCAPILTCIPTYIAEQLRERCHLNLQHRVLLTNGYKDAGTFECSGISTFVEGTTRTKAYDRPREV
jgi:hypothetical protein